MVRTEFNDILSIDAFIMKQVWNYMGRPSMNNNKNNVTSLELHQEDHPQQSPKCSTAKD